MQKRGLWISGWVLTLGLCVVAQSARGNHQALATVTGEGLLHSQANQKLEYLTDQIGERLTGTPAAQRAIAWALEDMRGMGLSNVHQEDWTMAHGWTRGPIDVYVIGHGHEHLTAAAMGWTGSTPKGGVNADVLSVNGYDLKGATAQAEANPGAWRGKVLLVRTQGPPPAHHNPLDSFLELTPFLQAAHEAGAVAVIAGQGAGASAGMNLTHTGVLGFNVLFQVPVINLTREDQLLLERLMDHSAGTPVRLHVDVENQATGPVTASNAVGDIPGTEFPKQIVIVGGHLDSWDLAQGATDNGTGAVASLAAARAILQSGYRPRRTVRVVLFTGEEEGLLGSLAYCEQHKAEMANTIAALILDEGQGPIAAMQVGGHDAALAKLEPLAKELEAFPSPNLEDTSSFDTDTGPFILDGVPGINLAQNSPNYRYTHHSPVDTFDHVRQDVLMRNAAEMAVMAYYIADLPERLDEPWTPAQVAAKLKEQGLEAELKAFGLWKFGN